MIEFVTKSDNKNLILFVHGFTGGEDTWEHPDFGSFPVLLLADQKVAYSGSKLPPIPDECCHPFHFKAATNSG